MTFLSYLILLRCALFLRKQNNFIFAHGVARVIFSRKNILKWTSVGLDNVLFPSVIPSVIRRQWLHTTIEKFGQFELGKRCHRTDIPTENNSNNVRLGTLVR